MIRRCDLRAFVGAALVIGGRLAAQTDSVSPQVAAGITAAGIAHHLRVLADDSMRGGGQTNLDREQTARYVAEQFNAIGLTTIEDNDGSRAWIHRYPVVDHLVAEHERSFLELIGQANRHGRPVITEGGGWVQLERRLAWNTDILPAVDTVLDYQAAGMKSQGLGRPDGFDLLGEQGMVLAGPHTEASVRQANLHGNVVIYVPPSGTDSVTRQQVVDQLQQSSNVVVVTDEDSAAFVKRRQAWPPPVVLDKYDPAAQAPRHWVLYLREGVVRDALRVGGVDVAEVRASRTPIAREVTMVVLLHVHGVPAADAVTAPNVVGLLPANDPQAKGYLVFTASMDRAGTNRGRLDSLSGGADADASGVAGLLELARSFRQLAGLRRPIVFAAVSGSAARSRGSIALAEELGGRALIDINFDLVGRRAGGDSIWIAGLRDVALPTPASWVVAQHPELGLTVVDGGTIAVSMSDPFPFVRNAIPSISVYAKDPDTAGLSDASQAVDADQEARVLRFLFYLGRDLAGSAVVPHWTSEGRQRLQRLYGTP